MATERELGIQITVNDATALASLKNLQATLRSLEDYIQRMGGTAQDAGGKITNSLRAEADAVRAAIAARQEQMKAINSVKESLEGEIATREEYIAKLQEQQTLEYALGPAQDRQIQKASEANTAFEQLGDSLSHVAMSDNAVRQVAYDAAAALETQQKAAASLAETTAVMTMEGRAFFDSWQQNILGMGAAPLDRLAAQMETRLAAVEAAAKLRADRLYALTGDKAPGAAGPLLTEVGVQKAIDDMAKLKLANYDGAASVKVFEEEERKLNELIDVMGAEAHWEDALGGRSFAEASGEIDKATGSMVRASTASSVLGREVRHVVGGFDAISRGQYGQLWSSVASGMRDAGLGATALIGSVGTLAVIMGARAIIEGADRMGHWAEQMKVAASASAMSVQDFTALVGVLKESGVKAESAESSLRHLAVTMGTALATPTSQAAEAFHVLGITQEQLNQTHGNAAKVLDLLADAYNRTADSANKSRAFEILLGRSFQELIPILEGGSQKLEAFKQHIEDMGGALTEQGVAKLTDTSKAIDDLANRIHDDAIAAFEAWGPTIQAVVGFLGTLLDVALKVTTAIGSVTSAVVNSISDLDRWLGLSKQAENQALRTSVITALGPLGPLVAGFLPGAEEPPAAAAPDAGAKHQPGVPGGKADVAAITKQTTELEAMRQAEDAAAEAASRGAKTVKQAMEEELQARINVIKQTLAAHTLSIADQATAEKELTDKIISLRHEQLSGTNAAAKAAARESYAEFVQQEKAKLLEAGTNAKAIASIYDEWAKASVEIYKQKASEEMRIENEKTRVLIELAKKLAAEQLKAKLEAIKESAREEEGAVRLLTLQTQLTDIAQRRYQFQGQQKDTAEADIQRSQERVTEAEQVQAMADKEVSALEQVRDAAEKGSQVQKDAQNEIVSVLTQAKQKEIELYKQAGDAAVAAANKTVAGWTSTFDTIGSQFEQFGTEIVKSLIAPQTTIIKVGLTSIREQTSGVKAAFRTLFLGIAQDIGKTLETALGHAIARALSGGASDTISDLLGKLFSKVFSSATMDAAGKALGSVASSATGAATSTAPIVSAITASATATGTAITAASTAQTTALSTAIASSTGVLAPLLTAINFTLGLIFSKPSVAGTTFAGGGIVSAAGGMVSMGGQIAFLHEREMVLPRHLSEGVQKMLSSWEFTRSNVANLNYSPNVQMGRGRGGTGMTRSEFNQMMNLHSGTMLGEARNMIRSGWRP
jgi:hypothetical protein